MPWKLILIVLAVLVAIPILLALIGLILPQHHRASRTARFAHSSPEQLFAAITNWREFPTWRSGVKSVEEHKGENGKPSWVEQSQHGAVPFETIESDSPRTLVTKIADPNLPFGGAWTWEIAPDGAGCRLTITEDGDVYNPIFRTMARFVFGYTATMDTYLKDLGRKFGEPVSPE